MKKILDIEIKKVKQEYRFLKYAIWKEKTTFTTAAHDSLIKDNIKKKNIVVVDLGLVVVVWFCCCCCYEQY